MKLIPVILLFWISLGIHAASIDCQGHLGDSVILVSRQLDAAADALKRRGLMTSPRAWRTETASFGLPGLDLPVELGGRGFSAVETAAMFEHAGRHALDLRDVVGAGHARLLAASPDAEIRNIVRGVARGEYYVAIAITEECAGSDVHAIESRAREVDGGFLLTGTKLFNARLGSATHVIVFTQSPGQTGRLRAFVMPIDHPGLRITDLGAHGLHGNSFGGLEFHDMFVPTALAIGGDRGGGQIFREHFLYWRLMMAAAAIGTGRGALEQTAERLLTRDAFGQPIGRFTHLQQPLAELTAKLHMAHLLVRETARLIDEGQGEAATPLAAMAKAEGVEIALAAADYAMKTFGAEGYTNRVDLGQRVIDLMGLRIADGTTDVLRAEVVRQIYGRAFWDLAVGTPSPAAGAPPAMMASPPIGASLVGAHTDESADSSSRLAPLVFADQANFNDLIRPGGGGACASVTAFNLLQILRAREPGRSALNPAAVLGEAFLKMPELLDGRVTDQQFTALLTWFAKFLRDEPRLEWSTPGREVIAAPADVPHQVYIYRVYSSAGALVGRHFVILRAKTGPDILVQDPASPYEDLAYTLAPSDAPERGPVRMVRPGSNAALYLDHIVSVR